MPEGPWHPRTAVADSGAAATTGNPLPAGTCVDDTGSGPGTGRSYRSADGGNLVAFRPERLVVHELLARVTADFSVEDGQKTEDLGINFQAHDCSNTDPPHRAAHDRNQRPHTTCCARSCSMRWRCSSRRSARIRHRRLRAGFWSRMLGHAQPHRRIRCIDERESRDVRAIRYWESQADAVADSGAARGLPGPCPCQRRDATRAMAGSGVTAR